MSDVREKRLEGGIVQDSRIEVLREILIVFYNNNNERWDTRVIMGVINLPAVK